MGGEEVDEDDTSVAVPKKGTELGWDASIVEELDDEGPGIVVLTSSAALAAGSSFAFPFGSAVVVVVAVVGVEGGGKDGGTIRTRDASPSCASSYPGSWSGGALAGSLGFRRPYRVHRL